MDVASGPLKSKYLESSEKERRGGRGGGLKRERWWCDCGNHNLCFLS
jgi:hypothetical protein